MFPGIGLILGGGALSLWLSGCKRERLEEKPPERQNFSLSGFSPVDPEWEVYDKLLDAGVPNADMDRGDAQSEGKADQTITEQELRLSALDLYQREPGNKAFREIVERVFPRVANTHLQIGSSFLSLDRFKNILGCEKASPRLEKAFQFNPNDPKIIFNSGVCVNDLPEAQKRLEKVLRFEPNFPGAHRELGLVLYQRGDYENARNALETAVRLDPNDSDAHSFLGSALIFCDPTQSAWSFRQALRINEDNHEARLLLGLILSATGKAGEGNSQLQTLESRTSRDQSWEILRDLRKREPELINAVRVISRKYFKGADLTFLDLPLDQGCKRGSPTRQARPNLTEIKKGILL